MFDSIREVIAGGFAGAATKTVAAPLDRSKLVVQLRGSLSSSASSSSYDGPIKALRKMVKEEGFLALWRGNVPTILIQGGTSALNFLFLDVFKKVGAQLGSSDLAKSFVSGGLAGATSITILYPVGLARTKLALDMGKEHRLYPQGMKDVFRQTLQVNGFASLYQGYGVALASVSLYRMVYLGGYDYCKILLRCRSSSSSSSSEEEHQQHCPVLGPAGASDIKEKSNKVKAIPFLERFLAAQTVSMAASTAHYPLDSIRRRLMVQSDTQEKKYTGAVDCFFKIYNEEGVGGYFRGLGTNYIRSIGAALVLVSYDFFKELLS